MDELGEPLRVERLVRQIVDDIEMRPYFEHMETELPDWVLKTDLKEGDLIKVSKWLESEAAVTAQMFYDAMNISSEMLKKNEYRDAVIKIMKPENRNCLRGDKAVYRRKLDFLLRVKKQIDLRVSKKVATD